MKANRRRLLLLVPIALFGLFFSLALYDRHSLRVGRGDVMLDLKWLSSTEAWWYDVKMRLRANRDYAPVTVAAIDDASIERFGRWPWGRGIFAELIELLYEEGARSVVFDVVFSEPEYKSKELEQTLKVPIPGRDTSLQKLFKLTDQQSREFSLLLPEIGDQYLGQSIWAHADKTVLGYFWRSSSECKILAEEEASADTALALGYLPRATWLNHMELILKHGFRVGAASDFEASIMSGIGSLGPVQLCPTINRGAVGSLSRRQGFFNAKSDEDGVFRRSYSLLPVVFSETQRSGTYVFPSLSLSALMAEYGVDIVAAEWRDYTRFQIKALKLLSDKNLPQISLDNDGSFLIDFSKRGNTRSLVPTLSLSRAGYWDEQERALIKDKVIMIGPTSAGVYDLRPNPVESQGAGVYIHASATSQLLELVGTRGSYQGIQSASTTWQLVIFWSFLGLLALSLIYSQRALITSVGWLVVVGLGIADIFVFRSGWSTDFALMAITWSLVLATITLMLYLLEERDRQFLKNAFARYVSPEIVRRIEENPDELSLDGERKEISILFSDIRGFTSVSESMEPDELRLMLNTYFKPMVEEIQLQGGTIDKFIGDAIMALFGAPLMLGSHPKSAAFAAENMLKSLTKLSVEDERFKKFDLKVGIAVASGFASVGNMGTDKIFNYTALGTVVNLASRLENLTKHYGVPLLIAHETYKALDLSEQARWRCIDEVRVSGMLSSVKIYDLPETHIAFEQGHELKTTYAVAYAAYRRGEWSVAKAAFEELKGFDDVSKCMLRRCELAEGRVLDSDWDGVWNFDHK
jgi:adenylate cyclase